MPQWLVIVLSTFAGLLIVGGALFLAILPELRARPRMSRLAEPSDNLDDFKYGGINPDGPG